MGADLSQGSGDDAPMSAINVTPFVDVVLVLLVIFMLTAPLLVKDTLQVKLPKSTQSDQKTTGSFGITVTKQGQFLLNGQVISVEGLRDATRAAVEKDPETQALISADTESKHGDVVRVIDLIKSSGLTKFAIQIEHSETP